ncbi:MAG: CHAT domain-containing protein [Cyanobacteriota bacterium]|nr:CHAT domain-containing protein [Cyanobacteriota bacterium]
MKKVSFLSSLLLAFAYSLFAAPNGRTAGVELDSRNLVQIEPTRDLEREARQLYEGGQYERAIQLLQQALVEMGDRGDLAGGAIASRNLAQVYLKLGQVEQADTSLKTSLQLVQNLENNGERQRITAQILEIQGQLQLVRGDSEDALDSWQKATETYQQIDDLVGATRNQINQTQALQNLGLYGRANKNLTALKTALLDQPDTLLKARALQNLGDVLRAVGQLEDSKTSLQQSLKIARELGDRETLTSILISIGNTARIQREEQSPEEATQNALTAYRQAAETALSPDAQLQAQLYQFHLLVEGEQTSEAGEIASQIQANLDRIPPNRTATYARIHFARSLMELPEKETSQSNIAQHLAAALKNAQTLGDKRAEAYTFGSLGKLYEQHQRWGDAQTATEKGLIAARGARAPEIAYQWQWQLGRVLCRGDVSACPGENRENAIAAYSQAVETLQSARSDLVAISSDVQFSFRESVEPVYRQLASLLLQPSTPPFNPPSDEGGHRGVKVSQANLKQARQVIEQLQLAELDNFFRDACLNATEVQIDQLDPNAAIFYTIILRDRLEVIAALPGQPLRNYSTPLPQSEVEQTLTDLQFYLASIRGRAFNKKRLQRSQTIYNWLLKPIESQLQASNIKTLVFVPDGLLRNLPIAALHDGEQYVVEKYSIATAPTLNLIDPQPLAQTSLEVFSAGLTEARQGFSALPNVELELKSIQSELPAEILLNQSFTKPNFRSELGNAVVPIVHLATHGEFSSKAEDTFILAWDEKINIEELNSLLRSDSKQQRPIELLVLSACQTAAGDKRAALGLAGMAVRAGARSTMASLWYVSDEATSVLMTEFYEELSSGEVTKAEALRRAQAAVLSNEKFAHPYYWSPFVLVGNWL